MSMVIGLALAQLLMRLAGFVQSPGKNRVYLVYISAGCCRCSCSSSISGGGNIRLQSVAEINFGVYLFLICFCCLFYFLCVLLNPPSIEDYGGFEEYFISRRRWFFGLLAVTYAVDLIDTLLKGETYFRSLGWEYPTRNVVYIVLCIIAAITANRRFQAAFVTIGLIYQFTWIFRLYDVLPG